MKDFKPTLPFWIGMAIIVASTFMIWLDIGKENPGYTVGWSLVVMCVLVLGGMFFLGIVAGVNGTKKDNEDS